VSKATVIRKKALDLVRQQDWQGAIKEYKRLVEMDQSNPNVHNELADIYLKTSAKAEAYDCFVRAIDEYTRVGLYNNAVAVAKKVMRVLPSRTEVLTLLGHVRMKQGLAREAESYYVSFLDKVAGSAVDAPTFKKLAREIAEAAPESVPVLQKLSQGLLAFQLDEDAGEILVRLYVRLEKDGNAAATEDVRASIDRLGLSAKLEAARAAAGSAPDPNRTVVTEQNIWTQTHSAGERIEIESTPRFTPPDKSAPAQPAKEAPKAAPADTGPSEKELYLLRLARGVGGTSPQKRAEKPPKGAPAKAAPAAPPAAAPAAPPAAAPAAPPAAAPAPVETPPVEEPVADTPPVATPVEAPEPEPAAVAAGVSEDDAPAASKAPANVSAPARAAAPARPAPAATPAREPAPKAPPVPPAKPAPPAPPAPPAKPAKSGGDPRQISALIDEDMLGAEGEDDYRSHYDLGMAYMEMDLLSEAIREYQAASKSPQFQVKCLEMIGLCFVRQKQPQLAIKQLSKGLAMIDVDSEESLGMKYNLGLAYEMVGDFAAARAQFEDVYVVDVTFRDVAEKVRTLAEKT
jgi:tetratricopeptide (TPR) repeat protein